jgi:hypothetical protein
MCIHVEYLQYECCLFRGACLFLLSYMLEGYLIAIAENDPQSESLSAMAKNDSIRKIGCK